MSGEGKIRHRVHKTVTVPLAFSEWYDLKMLAAKSNVSIGQYIRAICVDAIVEEQSVVIQCSRAQASPSSGEAGEANGAPAS